MSLGSKTYPHAGLIGVNSETIGGFEFAVAVAAFSLASAGVSEASGEGAGLAGISFTSSAASSATLDLTYPNAGQISWWREIQDQATDAYTFTLTAQLAGNVEPLTTIEWELPTYATVQGTAGLSLAYQSAGTTTVTLSAAGKSGSKATGTLTLSAAGFITNIGSPLKPMAGQTTLTLSSAATGDREWPIVMAGELTLSAAAVSAAESESAATASFTLAASGVGYQGDSAAGQATLTLSAIGYQGQSLTMVGASTLTLTANGKLQDLLSAGQLTHGRYQGTLTHGYYSGVLTHDV